MGIELIEKDSVCFVFVSWAGKSPNHCTLATLGGFSRERGPSPRFTRFPPREKTIESLRAENASLPAFPKSEANRNLDIVLLRCITLSKRARAGVKRFGRIEKLSGYMYRYGNF